MTLTLCFFMMSGFIRTDHPAWGGSYVAAVQSEVT